MNPIPMWSAMSYWQSRSDTFHDAMAWAVVQKGKIPAMQLTIGSGNTPTESKSVSVRINSAETAITFTGTMDVMGNVTLRHAGYSNIIISQANSGAYTVTYGSSIMLNSDNNREIEAEEFDAIGEGITLHDTNGTVTLSFSISLRISKRFSFQIYKYDGTAVGATINTNATLYPVPKVWRNSTRYVTVSIPEITSSSSATDGVYYYTMVDVDNVIRYSEPFLWLSNPSECLLATYRRSEPVITPENYLPFTIGDTALSLTMYIPGRVMMPPYHFDQEVMDIDGRKFPQKQISYRLDRMEFVCYQAFFEAIRLLWHCDIRTIGGNRIDYMEMPEVSWDVDTHLCKVVLQFQSDTVVQTNGNAAAYDNSSDSSHQSYDASFDQSFN